MGNITSGATIHDGPPDQGKNSQQPIKAGILAAAEDSSVGHAISPSWGGGAGQGNGGGGQPPNGGRGWWNGGDGSEPAPSYQGDVAHLIGRTLTVPQDQAVLPGLTTRAVNEDTSRLVIYDAGRAAERNQEYIADNPGSNKPYAEERMVVHYRPNNDAETVRVYDGVVSRQPGQWSTTPDQIREKTPDDLHSYLKVPERPQFVTNVETPKETWVERSFVNESSSPQATQFRIRSIFSRFFGEKKL